MLLCAAIAGAVARCLPQDPPPDARTRKRLVAEFFAADARSATGHARRMEIVKIFDAVPLERASDLKQARKAILAAADDRREMEQKAGRYFWWEEERRGLYILGGETRKPQGLLIGMHGGGAGAGDAQTAADSLGSAAREFGWLGIFPEVLEKTEHGWTDSGTEGWVLDLVECALRTWDLDPDRVFFSGHSMGGYGTWTLGAHHADRVAGLAASAGAPTPVFGPDGKVVEIVDGVVPSLRNVPFVVYQSLDDPNVPPIANQAAARAVAAAREKWGGYEAFEYWEVNGRGHDEPPEASQRCSQRSPTVGASRRPRRSCGSPCCPGSAVFTGFTGQNRRSARPSWRKRIAPRTPSACAVTTTSLESRFCSTRGSWTSARKCSSRSMAAKGGGACRVRHGAVSFSPHPKATSGWCSPRGCLFFRPPQRAGAAGRPRPRGQECGRPAAGRPPARARRPAARERAVRRPSPPPRRR